MPFQSKTLVVALLMAVLSAPAEAQYRDRVSADQASGSENVAYAYADVLRVDPVYEMVRQLDTPPECRVALAPAPTTAASTRAAQPTAASARATTERCRQATVEREERRVVGYDVEYRFKGDIFVSRLDYDPGNKLRVRITVNPAE